MNESLETIEQEGENPLDNVEDLIKTGRVPIYELALRGFGKDERSGIIFHIPPDGTQIGDQMERHVGGVYIFKSPDGKNRGIAASEWLEMSEGKRVRNAIEDALRGMGLDKSNRASYILRKVRRWFKETKANEF
jgi:hypothetical protein